MRAARRRDFHEGSGWFAARAPAPIESSATSSAYAVTRNAGQPRSRNRRVAILARVLKADLPIRSAASSRDERARLHRLHSHRKVSDPEPARAPPPTKISGLIPARNAKFWSHAFITR